MEGALRDSEQRFRALAEATSEGVAIHERGIILDANQHLAELLRLHARGNHRDACAGFNGAGIPRNCCPKHCWLCAPVRGRWTAQRRLSLHGELRGKEIPYRGKRVRVTTILDITEQKQAETLRLAIYRISEAAHDAQSLDALYNCIHNIVGELMPAANFYIALHDKATDTMSFPTLWMNTIQGLRLASEREG